MRQRNRTAAFCFAALVLTGVLCLGIAEAAEKDAGDYSSPLPADYEGSLTMWGWDERYFECIAGAFKEKYPNVTLEYTHIPNENSLQKYQTALVTGSELPDVAWAVIDSRAKAFELDMWEDLSAAPYNFDIDDTFEYLHSKMVNSKGKVCGIEQGISPAGLAYRKDLALQYLGTDQPQELEAMFPDWEAFIEKGAEVYEKSGGEVYMFQGLFDAQQFILEQGGKSWIESDVIRLTDAIRRPLELTEQFRDKHICDRLEAWSPSWFGSFGEGKHMFTVCVAWAVPFQKTAEKLKDENADRWALMNAPEGNISWGGTTMGITKTCKDKRLAWEFIRFAALSTEGARAINSIGYMTSALAPYEEDPGLCSVKSPWFGGQDLGKIFLDEIIPHIQARPMNFDDNVIHETLNLVTLAMNNDYEMTAEDAMKLLKKELEIKLPDYRVE